MIWPALFVIFIAALLFLIANIIWQGNARLKTFEQLFVVRQSESIRLKRSGHARYYLYLDGDLDPAPVGLRLFSSDGKVLMAEARLNGKKLIPIPSNNDCDLSVHISFEDGSRLVAAERFYHLENVLNFRDAGGYRTETGGQVAWKKVFRSADFRNLTEQGGEMLSRLGVKTVVDLRTTRETIQKPNQLPGRIQTTVIPIYERHVMSGWMMGFNRPNIPAGFNRLYWHGIVDEGAGAMGRALALLADPENLPLVFHCVSGKDRTGVLVALLLLTLDVPEQTVVSDYTLSNLYSWKYLHRAHTQSQLPPGGKRLGLRPEQFYPLMATPPELILNTLAYIRGKYGSVQDYLSGAAGLSEGVMDRIRANLLS